MGYLRGLGQDDGAGYDDSGDGGDGGSTVTVGTATNPITVAGQGPIPVSTIPAYTCADGGVVTDASYCAENTPSVGGGSSSSSGSLNTAALDSALATLLQGGTTIAKIATGQTGQSLSITSNELLIGAVILAAVFIVPAMVSKR
jgi:hypothetical protein